jgi:hypothetical protein
MRKTLTSLAPPSDTCEVPFLAKADISFATKSGHFNLLRTGPWLARPTYAVAPGRAQLSILPNGIFLLKPALQNSYPNIVLL